MTMTIDLTPELEMQLRDEAAKEGLAPDRFVLSAVEERLHESVVRPHPLRQNYVLGQDLEEGHRRLAADEAQEAEALEWAEATIVHLTDF